MSTNYYLKRIPTSEEIHNCEKCLLSRRLEDNGYTDFIIGETDSVEYWLNVMTEKIHLGKFSDGWKFLFRTHKEYYSDDLASVFQFIGICLSSGKWMLINEYGDDVDVKEFKDMVKRTMKDGIDIEEYWKKYPDRNTGWGGGPAQYNSFDGSRWWNVDFC